MAEEQLLLEIATLSKNFIEKHSGDKATMKAFLRMSSHIVMKGKIITDPRLKELLDDDLKIFTKET